MDEMDLMDEMDTRKTHPKGDVHIVYKVHTVHGLRCYRMPGVPFLGSSLWRPEQRDVSVCGAEGHQAPTSGIG